MISSATRRHYCACIPRLIHRSTIPPQSSRCPSRTSLYFSWSLTNPTNNARLISHSYPPHQAAEKQTPRNNYAAIANENHQPPLPIRIALVSTTTALATPSFPALGFLYLVLRVTIPDANLRTVMEGRWGTLLSFTTWTLLPSLYHGAVASLILPCAIGNAIVAGGVYGAVDLACGGPNGTSSDGTLSKALQTPWIAGSGIGATVGYIAPNYVYGPVMEHLYTMEGVSQSIQYAMSFPFATEVSIATGAVAGMILHPLLYFPMNGVAGLHWGLFSGTALAAVSSALVYVYYGRKEVGLPVPEGSFIEPSQMGIVDSIVRYNNVSERVETYSLKNQQFIGSSDQCLEGQRIADASHAYSRSGKAIFDDRVLAFVYSHWDANTKARFPDHVLNIRTERDIQLIQNSMALADASVAVILNNEQCSTDSTHTARMVKILATMDELNSFNKGKKALSPTAKQLEDVSVAIELLMTVKQSTQEYSSVDTQISVLERFIHSRYPELKVYTSDEQYKDESVESQLRIAGWKGSELPQVIDKWKNVLKHETFRTWRNRVLFVAGGVFLTIAGSMIEGSR